ncbi:glucosaminidase domain-containing protein [Weissella confusa]|uniref:glucosaminidase domain-containing protein n=1 Tax=Weissella confusa TaxID=1583 RepID=UPI001F5BB710|nr:glucosaminidase domain-containing protein [Weissella confusa]
MTLFGTAVISIRDVSADAKTDKFISSLTPLVQKATNQYNLYPSLQMAQAALESGWGTSDLTVQANNYFGIKGSYNGQSVDMVTAEYDSAGNIYYITAAFRKYPTPYESMVDNAKLLRFGLSWDSNFYSGTWRENASSSLVAADALTGKYATAPAYAKSLKQLINTYNLQSLDTRLKWHGDDLWGYDQNGNRLKNVWWQFGTDFYYFDADGNAALDLYNVDGRWYFFNRGAQVRDAWWYVPSTDGWYYFSKEDGTAKLGLQVIDGKTYYFDSATGKQLRNSWMQVNGKNYYFGSDGVARIGLQKTDKGIVFIKDDFTTVKSAWWNVNGDWYYFGSDGYAVTNLNKIDNQWYFFDAGKQVRGKWWYVPSTDGWYYFNGSDGTAKVGAQTIDGEKYFFNVDSAIQVRNQIQMIGSDDYYFGSDGRAQKTGFLTLASGYRFLENYVVVKNKWWNYDGAWYYFRDNGVAAMDLTKLDGKWYFFYTGRQVRRGWWYVSSTDGWYYFNESDGTAKTGLQVIGGKTYYFDPETGKQVRNEWRTINGKEYYFGTDGVAFKDGLLTLSTGYRFVDGDYNVVKNKWWNYDGAWYYFRGNGVAAMDLTKLDGKWYFFYTGRQVRSGWWYVSSTDGWYYFNESDGTAKTGLQVIEGKTYYFDPETAKQARNVTISVDGREYTFGADGVAV